MAEGNLKLADADDIFVTFPQKLYTMSLFEFNQGNIIQWNPEGKSFRIVDIEIFTEEILPKYFKRKDF